MSTPTNRPNRVLQRRARALAAKEGFSYQQALARLHPEASAAYIFTEDEQTLIRRETRKAQTLSEAKAALRAHGIDPDRAWEYASQLRPHVCFAIPAIDVSARASVSPGHTVLIRGKCGAGKSTALMALALANAAQTINVLYVTLEQSAELCETKLAALAARKPLDAARNLTLPLPTNLYVAQLSSWAPLNADGLAALIERARAAGFWPGLVCLDPLDLMVANSGGPHGITERCVVAAQLQELAQTQLVTLATTHSLPKTASGEPHSLTPVDAAPTVAPAAARQTEEAASDIAADGDILARSFDWLLQVWRPPGAWHFALLRSRYSTSGITGEMPFYPFPRDIPAP